MRYGLTRVVSEARKLERLISLPPGVRAFLRERVTPALAMAEVRRLMDQREETFLRMVQTHVFESPDSPYGPLFKAARCDFSDLQAAVRQHGLDGALSRLAEAGVYLTSEEFKGKTDIVRGGIQYRVSPREFTMPDLGVQFMTESSGTVNAPVSASVTLGWLAVRTLGMALFLAAHDLLGRSHAIYDAILPAAGGMNNALIYARLGIPPRRWFARKIGRVTHPAKQAFHYLTTQVIVQSARTKYPAMATPDFIDLDELGRIVDWVLEQNRAGRACCITTAASNAARIARTAADGSVALDGTYFIASGEPLTQAKLNEIKRVGAHATIRYAYGSSIVAGVGCGAPAHIDDAHLMEYMAVFLPHPRPVFSFGPAIHPLLCTTVHPAAPRFLINVANGDYGNFERKACGCPLGEAGLTLHISRIRSFEKLTGEGMTYAFLDLFDVMETILPAEFGGGTGDYQLVEEEDDRGQTRLTIRVDPAVGQIDEQQLRLRLYELLSRDGHGNSSMTHVWREAGAVRIIREAPHASSRGKILPLHIPR